MEETQESNVTQTTFPENFPGHLRHNRGLTRELWPAPSAGARDSNWRARFRPIRDRGCLNII